MKRHRALRTPLRPVGRRQVLGEAVGIAATLGAAVLWPRRVAAAVASATPTDLRWTDTVRQRTLPLLLRLPAGDAPCAVVLHSHGLGGSREGGAAWGQAWCDAGFAVLHLQHPGSDSAIFRGGASGLLAAASAEQLIARAGDVRFVLDELERQQRTGAAQWQRLRLDALGLSGHSFGAVTAMAVAGQRYPVPGDLADPRPRAFIAFSPSPGPAGRSAMPLAQQFGAITRPMLLMTGSHDGDPLATPGGGRDAARSTGGYRASVYEGLPRGQRALLWLDGADHISFGGGRPGEGDRDGGFLSRFVGLKRERAASDGEQRHHALIQRTSGLWWRAHLLGDNDAAAALRGPVAREGLAGADRWAVD